MRAAHLLCVYAALTTLPARAGAPAADDPFGRDLFGPTPPTEVVPAEGTLPDEVVTALRGIRPDPPPPKLTNERHYVISNERNLHYWHGDVVGERGGMLVGVGTDQMYVLAGWTRPKLLVLMDFDQLVVDVHLVYRAFFLEAETAEGFLALWRGDREGLRRAKAVLEARYRDDPEALKRAWRARRYAPTLIPGRLVKSLQRFRAQGAKTFLDDPDQYRFVRRLYQERRVVAVRGDLLAAQTMRDIADVARKLEVPVRVLYLSNTEMYFGYRDGFKPNILGLPFDERSVVLRTTAVKPSDYRYFVQPGLNFQRWLRAPKVWSVAPLLEARRRVGKRPSELFRIDAEPPPPAKPRR